MLIGDRNAKATESTTDTASSRSHAGRDSNVSTYSRLVTSTAKERVSPGGKTMKLPSHYINLGLRSSKRDLKDCILVKLYWLLQLNSLVRVLP